MAKRHRWLTAWIPHRLELMLSPSWSQAPIPLRRLLERVEIEHLRHGGFNNGELYVSFSQFVEAGISRRNLAQLLALGTDLGLIEVKRPDAVGDLRAPNAYRLTYLPAKNAAAPTDEWKKLTAERVQSAVECYRLNDKIGSTAKARTAA